MGDIMNINVNVNTSNHENEDDDVINNSSSSSSNNNNNILQQRRRQKAVILLQIPGPILLLDEWMDVETSTVISKIKPSMHKIVKQINGIVISVTHKPNLY